MTSNIEKLQALAEGHNYDYHERPELPGVCRAPEHTTDWPAKCWKADLTEFFRDNPEPVPTGSTDELAQLMIKRIENNERQNTREPLLVRYVFLSVALDPDGQECSYTAASNNIAVWDEMGLLKFGMTLCELKMAQGERS